MSLYFSNNLYSEYTQGYNKMAVKEVKEFTCENN